MWKWELQRLANRTGLVITVCHFPPGTSKWNKIEHRLFSHIAMNWRGTPLVDLATIVSLIGSHDLGDDFLEFDHRTIAKVEAGRLWLTAGL